MKATSNKPVLIVLAGPTAVGKTALGIALAQHLGTEIISADSRQVFRELNIGVARPSKEELAAVPHYLIAHTSIEDDYNAGIYANEALELVKRLNDRFGLALLVGGSGLYIKAVTDGFDELPQKDESLRASLNKRYKEQGIQALKDALFELDPYAALKDPDNPQRIIRAIEIIHATGLPYQESLEQKVSEAMELQLFYLNMDRETLYDRINKRVDMMLIAGLEEEARTLYPLRHLNALQTVGYKEFFEYFEGTITKEDAIRKIKQHSRNYAKRQLTWFRNDPRYTEVTSLEELLSHLGPLLRDTQ